jgi:hypothetical protein
MNGEKVKVWIPGETVRLMLIKVIVMTIINTPPWYYDYNQQLVYCYLVWNDHFFKNIFYNSFSFMLTSTCIAFDLYFGTLIIWILNVFLWKGEHWCSVCLRREERMRNTAFCIWFSNGEEGFKTNFLLYSYNLSY